MGVSGKETERRITAVLFIIYLVVLTWIILFKMEFDFSRLSDIRHRSINLIPFAGSVIVNGKLYTYEIILNVAAFVPLGVYISMLKRDWSLIKRVAPAFCVSLVYEALQYIFAIGGSDITDLLGNTLGGIIGIGIFYIFERILGKNVVKILAILAAIATVLAVLFIGLLLALNR